MDDRTAPPRQIGVREFRGDVTEFLRQVRHGSSFLMTSHNEVVAELHPPSQPMPTRRLVGALRGQIWLAPDFDTWPDEMLDAMEAELD